MSRQAGEGNDQHASHRIRSGEHLLQLAVIDHLLHHVQSTHELALDDKLRERGPRVDLLQLCRSGQNWISLLARPAIVICHRHLAGCVDLLCRTLSSLRMSKVV